MLKVEVEEFLVLGLRNLHCLLGIVGVHLNALLELVKIYDLLYSFHQYLDRALDFSYLLYFEHLYLPGQSHLLIKTVHYALF